jgi:hypothetical protein
LRSGLIPKLHPIEWIWIITASNLLEYCWSSFYSSSQHHWFLVQWFLISLLMKWVCLLISFVRVKF